VKEAIFSILGELVVGARVLDIFAGSGALGLEALSRGALECVFVEKTKKAAKVISDNIGNLGLDKKCRIMVMDALAPKGRLNAIKPFDLIFCDPPYNKGLANATPALVWEEGLLAPGGWLIIEHSPQENIAQTGELKRLDQRKYGQTMLSFFRNQKES
jgi:16S rRNA (guanine966-N2)-methyltransferase